MEDYKNLIIAVESNRSPLSIEEVDGYKCLQGGLICNKEKKKRNQALSNTKHRFLQLQSLCSNPNSYILFSQRNYKPLISSIHIQNILQHVLFEA